MPEVWPTYARRRPAVMVPVQHTSEIQARSFAWAGKEPWSRPGEAKTFVCILRSSAKPVNTKTILIQKSGLVSFVVASAMSRVEPVSALIPNPAQMRESGGPA